MKICFHFVVAILIFLNLVVFSQKTIELPIRWQKGEKLRYEIYQSLLDTEAGRSAQRYNTKTDLRIEILDADEDGYVVAWIMREMQIYAPSYASNPVIQRMLSQMKDVPIILQLDSEAEIQGVQNWKELKEALRSSYAIASEEMFRKGEDPSTLEIARNIFFYEIATREQIEREFTHEALVFFMLHGRSFSIEGPNEYEYSIYNPIGDEEIPGRVSLEVKRISEVYGEANIAWKQEAIPEEALRILKESLEEFSQRTGFAFEDRQIPRSFTIEAEAESLVDLSSGWHKRLNYTKLIRLNGNKWEYELSFRKKW